MAVEVGELGMLQLRIKVRDIGQEFRIRPKTAGRRLIGVRHLRPNEIFGTEPFLRLGIHQFAIGFFIPPHVAAVAVHHVGAGMHVANDALAGGNAARKTVLYRMTGFVAWNRGIGLVAQTSIAILGEGAGVHRRPIVCIDNVAGRAAARPVIAGMIVGAQEVKGRIQQARLLQADEDRICPVFGAQSARAQACGGLPESSRDSGMPTSFLNRPPRSKMRRTFPG